MQFSNLAGDWFQFECCLQASRSNEKSNFGLPNSSFEKLHTLTCYFIFSKVKNELLAAETKVLVFSQCQGNSVKCARVALSLRQNELRLK